MLEELVQQAWDGTITGVAMAVVYTDSNMAPVICTCHRHASDWHKLMAAASRLVYRLNLFAD